jgi:hypothetical protein
MNFEEKNILEERAIIESPGCSRKHRKSRYNFLGGLLIPFYLQSVPVHSADCVELAQYYVEECSVALFYSG